MLPRAGNTAALIVNKQTGQWGTKYDEKQDLVRVDMKGEAVDTPVDRTFLQTFSRALVLSKPAMLPSSKESK